MKKFLILILIPVLRVFTADCSLGFDMAGLQPLAPNGVFSTFSANTLTKGKVAASAGIERSIDPNYYRFSFQAAYGITDNMEVSMNFPYVDRLDSSQSGLEDTSFGFKHRFFAEDRYGPSMAYIITASLPSGRYEFSTRGRFGAGLVISKRIGPVYGHANLFYIKPGTPRLNDEITFLAGLDFSASHNHRLLAELYGRKGFEAEDIEQMELRFGYRFIKGEDFFATLGFGTDFKKRNPEGRIFISATVLFPSERKEIRTIYEE